MNTSNIPIEMAPDTFAERIKVLIKRVGSVTQIARMCGFSEGVVRSWRDGHTDPSRARCVTLARTLGISLVWLVAGEGALHNDPSAPKMDGLRSSEAADSRLLPHQPDSDGSAVHGGSVDAKRLSAAIEVLQSELNLANIQLSLADHTELLTQLYDILGSRGMHVDPAAMVTFNHSLTERIQKTRAAA